MKLVCNTRCYDSKTMRNFYPGFDYDVSDEELVRTASKDGTMRFDGAELPKKRGRPAEVDKVKTEE